MSLNSDNPSIQTARRIRELERNSQRRLSLQNPNIAVKSENSPALLTANQNDYDSGFYEVIYMTSDGAYSITGIAGGLKGRDLVIWNVGGYIITFSLNSTSSLPINRIISSTAADVTVNPNACIRLHYDVNIARWRTNGY